MKCAATEWRLNGDRVFMWRCHSPYFSPFSKRPWTLPSGMVIYAAMALSPHFGLFILNCFIVYLPLVVYDVHECFYFHFPLYFKFQAGLPDQNFYPCSKLLSYVVVFHPNVLLCLRHLCDFDCTYVP